MAYTEAHTALQRFPVTHWKLVFIPSKRVQPYAAWHTCPHMYNMLSQIYWVNNLPHHMGVCSTREAYYHPKCSPTPACLLFWSEECVCVCPSSHTLVIFLVCDLSANPRSLTGGKTQIWERRRTDKYEGGERETECRSGPKGLLHEGGLGSTANYAWHYWISCSACYILLRGVRRCMP